MRTLITLAIALFAAGTLALAAPPHASACTSCNGSLDDVATSADAIIEARVTGHAGGYRPRLASRSPISSAHVTLDSCGTGDHALPETATAAAAGGPAPGSALPGPLMAVAALVGYAAMLRRFGPKGVIARDRSPSGLSQDRPTAGP